MPSTPAPPGELLFRIASGIRAARSAQAVCGLLEEFAFALGFDRLVVCSISPGTARDPIDEVFFVSGHWDEGRSALERQAYLLHCPITRHILEFEEPFYWSKTPSRDGTRAHYRLVRGPRDLGETNGMQVPVFGRAGLEGAVSLAGGALDMRDDVRITAQAVCTLAFHALKRLRRLDPEAGPRPLTAREREILRWVAQGKQQAEIAQILAISERTVENHLRSVRRKLRAASTAQAVARGIAFGEIAS
ncbi:PA1136 family autoinducer-binding transcriptional regulator [Luteimonas aquatica]|uniref:PA1136 family autoinducer-binding transcriptional regulator n=1 Tax=Luteimonas aquatica TaxID=450364 RepID=UPI001F55CF4D|nr:PA1136 family autoinducer-binding transcriptional regulator [Luteimonas aquatica]